MTGLKKNYFTVLIFLMLFPCSGFTQNGTITGTVRRDRDYIKDVIVKIQNIDISTLTDANGRYYLEDVPPGKYYIIFIKSGYYSLVIPDVEVNSNNPAAVDVEMVPGDEKEYLFLEIGGIQVTADRELLSENPETVHRISSGEIEHMQANSLANVLDLIPGNEKVNSSGLDKAQRISIRNFDTAADNVQDLSMFGTKIIVDDIPLSNNADLQSGVGVGFGGSVQSHNSTQYDLREVVADNLEKVEVLSGASSVEYGDHTTGLILVQTKTINVPTRFRFKNNPDTREANLNGSFISLSTNFIYNFNYAYSERNIRITGDEFHRINGKLKAINTFSGGQTTLTQIFSYNRRIEEDNDPSDPYATKAYNRDHHFTYSHIFDINRGKKTNLYIRNFIDFNLRNSWKHKLETPDLAIWTDRMTPGTSVGIVPESGSYFSDITTTGHEWNFGSKIKYRHRFFTGPALNNLMIGGEFIMDQNRGPGKYYDILKPPGGANSSRPRSFDDTPAMLQLALFAEDRISGEFFLPYTLHLGLRIDSYNPEGISFSRDGDFFKARQGTFLNPRVGLKLRLAPRTQLRMTYSKSSKVPPLSSISPENFYLDVVDFTTQPLPGEGDTTIALVSTYLFDRSALYLKAYQNTKYEIAIDHQFGDFGLSFLGYYQNADKIPTGYNQATPFTYNRYNWPNWPDSTGKTIIETITTKDTKNKIANNVSKSEGYGLEFTFRTHRIPSLNMLFTVNAAFNHKNYSYDFFRWYGNPRTITGGDLINPDWSPDEELQVVPYYMPYSNWRQKMVLNYSVDYVAKSLGIWLRLKAQQVLLDKSLAKENPKIEAIGVYTNGQNYAIDDETSAALGFDRSFEKRDIEVDNSRLKAKWLFSLTASKSLYKGAEISFFVENIFNDRAYYFSTQNIYRARSPEIFWGIGFSTILDDLF